MKQIPKISIVILTRNAGNQFRETLEMIFEQQADYNFEVIVIDTDSKDETLSLCEKYPVRIITLNLAEFNFGLTRDLGFEQSSGEYVVTLSQDAVPVNKYWLKSLVEPLQNDKSIAAVQGRSICFDDKYIFYWERVGLFHYTRESRKWIKKYSVGLSFVNSVVRKRVWEANRMGNVLMGEDKIFQQKIEKNNCKIVFSEAAKVYHCHDYNIVSLAKRCANEGIGWKSAEVRYSLFDLIVDILYLRIYLVLAFGILRGEVRKPAELLLPVIRPIMLYIGNNYLKEYIR